MASVVGQRGQIVIEKPLRDALGLQPGFIAVQRLVGDHIELHFYPPEHAKSLRGLLARSGQETVSAAELQKARERAWIAESRADQATDATGE